MNKRSAASYFPAIWARAKERGVDEDTLRDRVEAISGQRSLRKLTAAQAKQLLDALGASKVARAQRRLAQGTAGRRDQGPGTGDKGRESGRVIPFAGPGDWRLLLKTGEARGWDEAAVRRWCERQIKRPKPRTMAELNKCLWGIKALNRRDGIGDGGQRDEASG